ncbi:hypothetical protein HDU97_003404 [Phlyctochytrium planicorne]|nr:hypothetical protein HDU97_003404 [Phlyctochytrium planicorne]
MSSVSSWMGQRWFHHEVKKEEKVYEKSWHEWPKPSLWGLWTQVVKAPSADPIRQEDEIMEDAEVFQDTVEEMDESDETEEFHDVEIVDAFPVPLLRQLGTEAVDRAKDMSIIPSVKGSCEKNTGIPSGNRSTDLVEKKSGEKSEQPVYIVIREPSIEDDKPKVQYPVKLDGCSSGLMVPTNTTQRQNSNISKANASRQKTSAPAVAGNNAKTNILKNSDPPKWTFVKILHNLFGEDEPSAPTDMVESDLKSSTSKGLEPSARPGPSSALGRPLAITQLAEQTLDPIIDLDAPTNEIPTDFDPCDSGFEDERFYCPHLLEQNEQLAILASQSNGQIAPLLASSEVISTGSNAVTNAAAPLAPSRASPIYIIIDDFHIDEVPTDVGEFDMGSVVNGLEPKVGSPQGSASGPLFAIPKQILGPVIDFDGANSEIPTDGYGSALHDSGYESEGFFYNPEPQQNGPQFNGQITPFLQPNIAVGYLMMPPMPNIGLHVAKVAPVDSSAQKNVKRQTGVTLASKHVLKLEKSAKSTIAKKSGNSATAAKWSGNSATISKKSGKSKRIAKNPGRIPQRRRPRAKISSTLAFEVQKVIRDKKDIANLKNASGKISLSKIMNHLDLPALSDPDTSDDESLKLSLLPTHSRKRSRDEDDDDDTDYDGDITMTDSERESSKHSESDRRVKRRRF